MISFKHFGNDFKGGLVAGIIALPLALAFGVASFAPLGNAYISAGVIAGLYGAIFTGIFAALLGGTPTQITGPTGPMAVVATASIALLFQNPELLKLSSSIRISVVLFYFSILVILGGIFQIIFAISKLGKIVKYIPYSVIAGFMNGIAIIIFIGQLKPFVGFSNKISYTEIINNFSKSNLLLCIVGIITILGIIFIPKIIKAIPSSLAGLISGVVSYLIIGKFFDSSFLNLENNTYIIGAIPSVIPKPVFFLNMKKMSSYFDLNIFYKLIAPALTLGILGSIDSLLTSVVADVRTKTRHNSIKELIGQGTGNIVSGIFGGIPGAGATVRTLVNIDAGGKTNLSGIIHGIFLLLVLIVLGSLVQWIPMAVLAGILLVTAIKMIDVWSISLIKKKTVLQDVIIMLVVTIVTVVLNLMIAVAIGLVIACILFIKSQMKNNVVKRIFSANVISSKKIRKEEETNYLKKNANKILIIELQGSLFFGNTNNFSEFMEKHIKNIKYIIFDLKNIVSIDLTGAQLLLDLFQRLKENNIKIALSGLEKFNDKNRHNFIRFLSEIGVFKEIKEKYIFYNYDYAIEFFEDLLLKENGIAVEKKFELNVEKFNLFEDLNLEELNIIKNKLVKKYYKENDIIFKAGEEGDGFYFISKGSVSIVYHLNEKITKRIISYGQGVNFGEMAVIENKPRSATVIATEETLLYFWSKTDFYNILNNNAALSSKILKKICSVLSNHLRNTSKELKIFSE